MTIQKKYKAEISELHDALLQVKRDYDLLRMEFEQNLKANEQTGKWVPLSAKNKRGFFQQGAANEDIFLRTHCCRHKCFPVCLHAQHLLRTQKMFLILFRNILCPQQMFPSLRSMEPQHSCWRAPKKHHEQQGVRNNVSSFARALTAPRSADSLPDVLIN